jgi:hypothetical protein
MKRLFKYLLLLLFITPIIHACSGGSSNQISGIVAEAQYDTAACQPKTKIINVRNENTSDPQRIRGVYFEMGTNNDNIFKIDKVTVGGNEFSATASMVEEIIIPAGGVMSIQATYNPRAITPSGQFNTSYVDIFLNGPKLGIIQVRLKGQAETAAEGCTGGATGNEHVFNVSNLAVAIFHSSQPGGKLALNADVTGTFKFTENSGAATVLKDDFPKITIHIPPDIDAPIHDLEVKLDDASVDGTFAGSDLEFETFPLVAAGAVHVAGKLTTKNLTLTNTNADFNETGASLSSDGKTMKLVYAAKLDDPNLPTFAGGIVGFEMELTAP